MGLLQGLPSRFRREVEGPRFVVAVAEPSQPAEQVGQVHDTACLQSYVVEHRSVMKLNHCADVLRQFPLVGKNAAALGMRKAEDSRLHFAQRSLRVFRNSQGGL